MVSVLTTVFTLWLGLTLAGLNDVVAEIGRYGAVAQSVTAHPQPTTVAFVGDMMLARDVERRMFATPASDPFQIFTAHDTSDYAAVLANFEAAVPVVHEPTPPFHFRFSVATSTLARLANSPISHVSLANNHSTDHGTAGVVYTRKTLPQYGIESFGHRGELSTSSTTFIPTGNGVVAVVAIEQLEGSLAATTTATYFDRLATVSDVQIAYVHFGTEYKPTHDARQQQTAHTLIDAGADVVVGHHPHVVQDVEQYKDGLIFYSLGNFIFDQYFERAVQEGLWLDMSLHPESLRFTLRPVTSVGSPTVPRFMSGGERDRFLDDLADRSMSELREQIEQGSIAISLASSSKRAMMAEQ